MFFEPVDTRFAEIPSRASRLLSQVAAPATMKLSFAVLALLCLSTAVNASSNAADFKLPLAGLFTHGAASAVADANITVSGEHAASKDCVTGGYRKH